MKNDDFEACKIAIDKIQEGDWDGAHEIVQSLSHVLAYRLHGLLHWQEGDNFNARYWYSMANLPFPRWTIEEELLDILEEVGFTKRKDQSSGSDRLYHK